MDKRKYKRLVFKSYITYLNTYKHELLSHPKAINVMKNWLRSDHRVNQYGDNVRLIYLYSMGWKK